MSVIDSIVKLSPVNMLARIVTGKGHDFIPDKKVLTGDSECPIPIRKATYTERKTEGYVDLTGRKVGALTVLGMSDMHKGKWVVRCACGIYTTRHSKAIKNPRNDIDCCEHCRHLRHLKREEYYRRTGKNLDE